MPRRSDTVALRDQLAASGLPPAQCDRLVIELLDHARELEREELAIGTAPHLARARAADRLGDPRRIARIACAHHPVRTLLIRWRAPAFIGGPFIVGGFATAAHVMLTAGAGTIFRSASIDPGSPILREGVMSLFMLSAHAMVAGVALLFCLLARVCDLRRLWPLLSCGVIALLWSFSYAGLVIPAAPDEQGMITFGLTPTLHAARLLIPLSVFVIFCLLHRKTRPAGLRVMRHGV